MKITRRRFLGLFAAVPAAGVLAKVAVKPPVLPVVYGVDPARHGDSAATFIMRRQAGGVGYYLSSTPRAWNTAERLNEDWARRMGENARNTLDQIMYDVIKGS